MKSLKKTLVLLVVFSMILSAVMPAFAATDVYGLDCEEEVARLEALDVVSGYEDGTYGPENTITRAEMAVILCKMVGIDTVTVDENKNVPSKFSDVAAGAWYTGYINVAAGKGLLSGFPDGTFRPEAQLTMNQVLTLCVNALGRGEYVAEMGTWPANYIAEATKLGLLDGVKTSDANRGNVAIIVWNTLEAPYVWDVMGTEFEGTINLQNSSRSLLSIYFRDYTYDVVEGNEKVRELKEVETKVASTPARNAEIGDRQIVLPAIDEDFDFKTTFKKKDVKEECTYAKMAEKTVDGETVEYMESVVAYVPEEVYEDIDSLRGKTVTVVFGKDNVVALIVVEDDIVEDEFITKYAADDNKITVGENVYKLAKTYTVTLNDTKVADLATALTNAGSTDHEDIEKKIQARLTLDIDDKVEKIDLFASATIAGVSTESLVIKVKESSKKYEIQTIAGDIEWNLDDEEDIDFPRVYVDGVKGDIRDIAAGNVLTVLGSSLKLDDITAIYVSTNTVVGEATKVKKSNNAITIDGELYMPSFDVTNKDVMTEEELEDEDWKTFNSTTILDNDGVTLYMNVLGEYVFVAIAEATNDYQFGVVTYASSNITWEGDDDEIAVRNIKILLDDGSKKTFKVKADTNDDDISSAVYNKVVEDTYLEGLVGDFVIFEANADSVITLEDGNEIEEVVAGTLNDDYVAKAIRSDLKVDGKTFAVSGATALDHAYTSKTVIFNGYDGTDASIDFSSGACDCGSADSTSTDPDDHAATCRGYVAATEENYEVVKEWDSILTYDDSISVPGDVVPASTIAVFETNSKKALYILVDMADYATSDAEYAVVASKLVEVKDGKYEIDFVGSEAVEVKSNISDLRNSIDWFVKYTLSSGKVNTAKRLIDLDAFVNDLEDDELLTSDEVINEGASDGQLTLVTAADGATTKKHLKVEEVTLEKDYASIEFIDEVEKIEDVFARGTYYTFAELAADAEFDANETYYKKSGTEYVKETVADATEFGTKKATLRLETLAENFNATTNTNLEYYTYDSTNGKYVAIAAALEANPSIGFKRLDEDNLVVLDLRNGTVEEITLDKVPANSYVVLYKEVGICNADCAANVVIVVE